MYFNLINVDVAQMVQVGRVASDKEPLLTSQDSFMGAYPDIYNIKPALIHIVIQKILGKNSRHRKIKVSRSKQNLI